MNVKVIYFAAVQATLKTYARCQFLFASLK